MPRRKVILETPFLDSILALNRLAVGDLPLQPFLDQVTGEIARATTISHIKVLRYRPQKGDLLVEAGVGWREGVIGQATLPIDVTSPPGRVIQTGRSSLVEDFDKETEFKLSGMLKLHGIKALLNVPIKVDGAVWGVLEADSNQPCHFTEQLTLFLKAAAHLIGTAIQREAHKNAAEESRTEFAREVARREMLLTEMHHRVKNNFQVIVSTLLLQRRKAIQDETKDVLQAMSDRVMAIALAHDQLDPRQTSQTVNLANYLSALCRTIGQLTEEVAIETNFDEGKLPIEEAVALGLILNELLANSMKHAFDGRGGRITVTFNAGAGEQEGYLTVTDDGKGMGAARQGSSGTSLIDALVSQLQGRIERERPRRGTMIRICFPMR